MVAGRTAAKVVCAGGGDVCVGMGYGCIGDVIFDSLAVGEKCVVCPQEDLKKVLHFVYD